MKAFLAKPCPEIPERRQGATSPLGALTCLSLAMLMPSLDTSIANVALPALGQAFAATFHQVQWIILSYLLAITTLVVSAGRLGDLFGRRRLLQIGVGMFSVASLLCGLAPTYWALIAARTAQGLGAAIMIALTVALVGETVPKERTGSALGLLGTMSAVGTMLGPSLGGSLTTAFGWRAIFLVNVPLGLVTALLAQRHLPRTSSRATGEREAFDGLGTLLLGLTLAAYALAVTTESRLSSRINLPLLAAAFFGAGLFVAVEARVASPLIRLEAFRGRVLGASLAMNTIVASVMMATLVIGPFYLSRALGLREVWVGLVMSVGPALSILTGVPAGRVVDRLGAPSMVAAALLGMAVGALALTVLPARFGVPGYLAAIAILTPGYQLFQAANSTAVMRGVQPDRRGVISGLLSLSRNLGLITGASTIGAVFALASKTADLTAASPEAVTAGFRATFAVAAGLITLAAALAVTIRSRAASSTEGQPGPRDGRQGGGSAGVPSGTGS
jgi:EmrB/QacA subfamily drug resistance transporter